MNVLEVCQEFPNKFYPQLGTFVKQSVDAISNQGVSVTVVSPKPFTLPYDFFPYHNFYQLPAIAHEIKYDVHHPRYIYFIPKKYLYSFSGMSYSLFTTHYAKKYIKNKPDLIHAHFSYPDGYGMINLSKEWNVPLVVSALGTIERKIAKEGTATSKLIVNTLKTADKILSVSDDLKMNIISLGIDEEKIHVVPNGVDVDSFKSIDQNYARRKLKLPCDKKFVLYVGSLRKIKGVDYLVESAIDFVSEDVILLLVGRDDGLKPRLVKRAKELQIDKYIMFIDQVKHEDIVFWMSCSDVLVLPSLSEGRPNVVLEALSCGLPVVATNVGGTPEILSDYENGILVESCNSKALARKVNEVLYNPKLRNKLIFNGRKNLIENGLTWEAHGKKTVDIYSSLLEEMVDA
jgi:glycosyltransferase involved in cell wall biosynthesis